MKPAMKMLIGAVVLGIAAYGGNIAMDKVAKHKAELAVNPVDVPIDATAGVVVTKQEIIDAQPTPHAIVQDTPAVMPEQSTNSGMSALLESGKK